MDQSQIFKALATLKMIDTTEMRTAIKAIEAIPKMHRWAICSCLTSAQWMVEQGMDIVSILNMKYQDIYSGIEPTEEALTDEQRLIVLGVMVNTLLGSIDSLKGQISSAYNTILNPPVAPEEPTETVPEEPPVEETAPETTP